MSGKVDRYDNWTASIEKGVLTITINVDESQVETGLSGTGKNLVLATTGGIKRVPKSPLKINMTVFRKP